MTRILSDLAYAVNAINQRSKTYELDLVVPIVEREPELKLYKFYVHFNEKKEAVDK